MGLSFSPVLPAFIDDVFKSSLIKKDIKVIMDDTMICSTHKQHFEGIDYLCKALIKSELKISPQR